MNYNSNLLIFFATLFSIWIFFYLFAKFLKQHQLKIIRALPFPPEYHIYLDKTSHYKHLCDSDKKKIEASIIFFIHTKRFVAVNLEMTDEMKVVIAFYACLLLLKIPTKNCFDEVTTIIIYSHVVATNIVQSHGGIYSKETFVIEGEATYDTVVISWHEAKKDAYHLRHNNVIIHEFTHEIDFMTGETNGVPPLEKSKYNAWASILLKEFNKLNTVALKNRNWGKYELLGSYASTNEAEFFAVISERFFESPKSLNKHFPQLYAQLKSFYGLDSEKLLSE